MKKINPKFKSTLILVLCFIFDSLQLFAQTLTAAHCAPVPGDSLAFQKATYADPGPSGAGQFWDFSQIIHDGVPIVKKYFIPLNVPTHTAYPRHESNLAYSPESGLTTTYMLSDSSGLYDLGDAGRRFIFQLPDTINHPPARDILMKFPFHLNDSCKLNSSYFDGLPPYGSGVSEQTKLISDATGTLITPCGTYTNTIRIHRFVKGSTRGLNTPSSSHTVYYDIESYEWYAPGIHGAILSIFSSTGYSWWSPTSYFNWSIIYNDVSKTPLGIGKYLGANFDSFHFQNPSRNILNLEIEEDVYSNYTVHILDLSGKTLISSTFSGKTYSMDVSAIAAGIYILQIKKEDGTLGRKKLIIEH